MKAFCAAAAVVLLLTIIAGLVRILRGPTMADRMLAAQLFGTTGVGVLLLLGVGWDQPRALDVALVVALLASVMGVAFVFRGWVQGGRAADQSDERH
jgi:multicomponent Na+:H+ antiporter subunit F